jgi:plasmid stabilization system protein ParE
MPKTWSQKDERKYQHIKASERKRGASARRAEEIAARTVNKSRRLEGRTPNRTSQGTGNPRSSLEERSVQELRNRAAQLDIKGRSRMNKSALIAAIRAAA